MYGSEHRDTRTENTRNLFRKNRSTGFLEPLHRPPLFPDMKSKRILAPLALASILLQGCVAEMVMKYSEYVTETQRLNLGREKAACAGESL